MQIKNAALLFKWWWKFSSQNSMPWKKIVCSCNNLSPHRPSAEQPVILGTGIWTYIWNSNMSNMSANSMLRNGIQTKVGNSEMTRFWEDV